MDIETLNKGNEIQDEIKSLRAHITEVINFITDNPRHWLAYFSDGDGVEINLLGKYVSIDSYKAKIEAEIRRLEQDFEDLQPVKKAYKPDPRKSERFDWLTRNHFIISDGTHTSADGKVQSNDGDFIIKIGGELIIVSPELMNDFEEFTDAQGNVHSRWNAMVERYRQAVREYQANEGKFFD